MTTMWPLNTHGGGDVRSCIISVQPCYEISILSACEMPSLAKGLGGACKWAERECRRECCWVSSKETNVPFSGFLLL
jgi:hypothetical protein